jgi:hypothetical protein
VNHGSINVPHPAKHSSHCLLHPQLSTRLPDLQTAHCPSHQAISPPAPTLPPNPIPLILPKSRQSRPQKNADARKPRHPHLHHQTVEPR